MRVWVIAAYMMPENAQEIALLRVVVHENFSRDMADILYQDIENACTALDSKRATEKPQTEGKHRPIC